MAVGDARAQTLASWRPAAYARHIGRSPGFVDEDQPLGIEIKLTVKPFFAPLQDVRSFLFACVRSLFFHVTPRRAKKRQIAEMDASKP